MDETISLHINHVVTDFDGSWRLVLVEGPWEDPTDPENVRNAEKRILDCVTASINGYLAQRYPDSEGCPLVIQLDSYDTPRTQMDALVRALQEGIDQSSEIQECIRQRGCVSGIQLIHNWFDFDAEFERRNAPPPGLLRRALKFVGLA